MSLYEYDQNVYTFTWNYSYQNMFQILIKLFSVIYIVILFYTFLDLYISIPKFYLTLFLKFYLKKKKLLNSTIRKS